MNTFKKKLPFVFIVILFFTLKIEANSINIIPAEIDAGSINPSINYNKNYSFTLVTNDPDLNEMEINVLLLKPLTRISDGFSLPQDRILLNNKITLSQTMPYQIILSGLNSLGTQLNINLNRFDSPGDYQAKLKFWETGKEKKAIEMIIKLEILKWVQMKPAQVESVLTTQDQIPGPNSYLTTGKDNLAYVSSNTNWTLVSFMETDFRSYSAFDYIISKENLLIRAIHNEWIQPISDNFQNMMDKPVILALGKSTGNCADGWVPVRGEMRLPYTRSQVAGDYVTELQLIAILEFNDDPL